MAITLEDLLGKNEPKTSVTGKEFPSFAEFKAIRNGERVDSVAAQPRYENYSDSSLRSEREYLNTDRSYAPERQTRYTSDTAFQGGDYAFYDSLRAQSMRAEAPPRYADEAKYGYAEYETFAKPSVRQSEKVQSLYDYTKSDNDRQSEQVLMDKLSHTNAGSRPIFDKEAVAAPVIRKKSLFRVRSDKAQAGAEEKTRARLNTKGKIILGVYIGVIVLVAVLIIVNANKINNGTAKQPSSSVNDSYSAQYADASVNISEAMQIDSRYEARI